MSKVDEIKIKKLIHDDSSCYIKEGYGNQHISYFPPYTFFKSYVNGEIEKAVSEFTQWYDNQFRKYHNTPKAEGGMYKGSLYRLIKHNHKKYGIELKENLENLDQQIYWNSIKERVQQRISLLESIKEEGFKENGDTIVAVKKGDNYILKGGHHRCAILKLLEYETMPVKVYEENQYQMKKWIDNQQWYQKIELSDGLTTKGKVSVANRLHYFSGYTLKDKTFLDIGCNSGGYCLWAKKQGATKVNGIDIDEHRITQAKTLAEYERLDIDYQTQSIFELNTEETYDFIFCISVITEITDLFGALTVIKQKLDGVAFIEIGLARPKFYYSTSDRWKSGYKTINRQKAVMELMEHKRGYMVAPSLEILKSFFGDSFHVEELGKGERYDMVKVERV